MSRLLVLGKSGQVATELRAALAPLGEVICAGREECDFAQPLQVEAFVREARPRFIVNAAAYTAVDKAESEAELCRTINAASVGALGAAAKSIGAPVIHYSTDYVFDGTKRTPYVETDAPNPLNVYGRSKLEGEQALAASGAAHLIFRISWIYGPHGANFLRTMLRLAREREELKIVDDQYGAPTSSFLVARQSAEVMRQALASDDPAAYISAHGGICHLSAGGVTTWRKFAEKIFALDPGRAGHALKRVLPISASEYPTPAKRPAYSVMDNSLAVRRFGLAQEPWETGLERALRPTHP